MGITHNLKPSQNYVFRNINISYFRIWIETMCLTKIKKVRYFNIESISGRLMLKSPVKIAHMFSVDSFVRTGFIYCIQCSIVVFKSLNFGGLFSLQRRGVCDLRRQGAYHKRNFEPPTTRLVGEKLVRLAVDVPVCRRVGCRRFGLSTNWPINLSGTVNVVTFYMICRYHTKTIRFSTANR